MHAETNAAQYIEERLDDQIQWLDRKSSFNQRWFKRLRVIEIAAAASIPLLTGLTIIEAAPKALVIGGLGAMIAVIGSMLSIYRFQENWTEYRGTAERLKRHKYLFRSGAPPYDGDADTAFHLLVKNVEAELAEDFKRWSHNHNSANVDRGPNQAIS